MIASPKLVPPRRPMSRQCNIALSRARVHCNGTARPGVSGYTVRAFASLSKGEETGRARPGGNITGITVDVGYQTGINGKRLQILKEAVPSASKIAVLSMRTTTENVFAKQADSWKPL